jgi:hypothetical protein
MFTTSRRDVILSAAMAGAALRGQPLRKSLDRVIADDMMVCGSHFPWPGLGKIASDGAAAH